MHPALAFVIGLVIGAVLMWMVGDGKEDDLP
jgi:hypothetical protein